MPIPTDVSTANIDSETDDPRLWRADGLDHMQKFNELLALLRGDAGEVKATATGSTTARTLADRFADAINVRDFGAVGDGVKDDTAAIQAALNASKSVGFPPGSYLITSSLQITQDGQELFGLAGIIPQTVTPPGPRLVYHPDLGTAPLLDCQKTAYISNLGFRGPEKGTGTAVRAKRLTTDGAAYEDTDVTIQGCQFQHWDIAVEHWNRGLLFDGNVVALCDNAVTLHWDDANVVDDPGNPFDLLEYGFRAIRITGNRFHAVTCAVVNTGTNAGKLRGLIVADNQIDIGDQLFQGGCRNSVFTGNVIDQTSAPLGAMQFTTGVSDLIIANNVIIGDEVQGFPTQLVGFSGAAENVTINGNVFRNATAYGINHSGAVTGVTYSGNTFFNLGTDGNNSRACIRFQTGVNVTDTAISGNTFRPVGATYCIRGTTDATFAGVVIQGNAWDRTKTLAGIYIDGGNNSIQS